MAHQIDLNPATHLTIGTVGVLWPAHLLPAGQPRRTDGFARHREGTGAVASRQPGDVSRGTGTQEPTTARDASEPIWLDALREPVEEVPCRQHGLGFSEETSLVVIIAYELVEEGDDANVVSFWVTRSQVQSLIKHITDVVKQGRPICGNCGRPIDPDGHFCPNRNGHRH
jgi:hypothetical protein